MPGRIVSKVGGVVRTTGANPVILLAPRNLVKRLGLSRGFGGTLGTWVSGCPGSSSLR
jgi:hypothetical protein